MDNTQQIADVASVRALSACTCVAGRHAGPHNLLYSRIEPRNSAHLGNPEIVHYCGFLGNFANHFLMKLKADHQEDVP